MPSNVSKAIRVRPARTGNGLPSWSRPTPLATAHTNSLTPHPFRPSFTPPPRSSRRILPTGVVVFALEVLAHGTPELGRNRPVGGAGEFGEAGGLVGRDGAGNDHLHRFSNHNDNL